MLAILATRNYISQKEIVLVKTSAFLAIASTSQIAMSKKVFSAVLNHINLLVTPVNSVFGVIKPILCAARRSTY